MRAKFPIRGLLLGLVLLPQVALAQAASFKDARNFSEFVTAFWHYASHIIFTLAVLTIITGGVVYVASAGVQERVDAAKEIIKGAIISIILVIISGSAIDMLLDKPSKDVGCSDAQILAGTCSRTDESFKVLNNTSSMVIALAGAFTVIMIMFNAIKYITAAGDEEKIAEARKGLTYAIIGLVICVTAFVVVRNVISIF